MGVTAFAAGETRVVAHTLMTRSRIDRLVIPTDIAENFQVMDIQCDRKSVLLGPPDHGVHGSQFMAISEGFRGLSEWLPKGAIISAIVTNLDTSPQIFTATFIGEAEPKKQLPSKLQRSPS